MVNADLRIPTNLRVHQKSSPLENLSLRLGSLPAVALLGLTLAVNVPLMIYTSLVTLRAFPNSADEYSYLLSATLFAEGKLSVPSPEPREFFTYNHMINDGRYYGKYAPGWPILLSVGVLLGVPWAVNIVLGVATIVLIWRIALSHFGGLAANFAMCCLIANPYFVFTSASYFSHTAAMLFIVAFLYFFLRALDRPASPLDHFGMGVCAGMAFLTRPFSTIAVIIPLGAALLLWAIFKGKLRVELRGLAASVLGFGIFFALFVGYNLLQTGHPFLQPFQKYDPTDALGFNGHHDTLPIRLQVTLVDRLLSYGRWLPLSLIFLAVLAIPRGSNRGMKSRVLLIPFVGLLLGHFFYWGSGINQYGPRYMYESAGATLLAAGCVLATFPRSGLLVAAAVLGINCAGFWRVTRYHSEQVRERMTVYDCAAQMGLSDAVVFLRSSSGDMPEEDLTRNGTRFDGPVLYVIDRGMHNPDILRHYPGRKPYVFEYDQRRRTGTITPWVPRRCEEPAVQ